VIGKQESLFWSPKANAVIVSLVIFTVLFFVSRIWIIEGDLAPFQLTQVQKLDAQYYVMAAFEWLDGKYEPRPISGVVSVIPNGLFYNAIVYLNLLILGQNYYGFRLNVVVVSCTSSLLFSYLFYRRFGRASLLITLPTFLLSFPWFMASLEVEPTTYRTFHMALFCGLFAFLHAKKLCDTLYGRFALFCSALFGPFFVYPTNLFIIFALYAFYFLRGLQRRQVRFIFVTILVSGAAWLLVAVTWVAVTVLAFGKLSTVLDFFSTFTDRVTDVTNPRATIWYQIVGKFWDIELFGLFRETPLVFYLYLIGLVAMIIVLFMEVMKRNPGYGDSDSRFRGGFNLIMPLLSLALFFQTLFVNDYPLKKLSILVPFILLGALFVFEFIVRAVRLPLAVFCTALSVYMVSPSAALSYEYLYAGYTENFKRAMVGLNDIGPVGVAGGFSHSFRLYNSIRPYASYYVFRHVLHDMDLYRDILAGRIDGVRPEYSIQIELNSDRIEQMRALGFQLDRLLIEGKEEGVGSVGLFKRIH
jgi:hypothetical protein